MLDKSVLKTSALVLAIFVAGAAAHTLLSSGSARAQDGGSGAVAISSSADGAYAWVAGGSGDVRRCEMYESGGYGTVVRCYSVH
ncbi:hypothetical protein BH10PSE2_BH10PSE2_24250 [soil metagenome]